MTSDVSIVVDTSALAAVVFGEPDATTYATVLTRHVGMCIIAAPTLLEASIVVQSRTGEAGLDLLETVLDRIRVDVVPFDRTLGHVALDGWRRFGKGRHPAALNLGDCFSYALARHTDAALLFKGDDFAQTDIRSALP